MQPTLSELQDEGSNSGSPKNCGHRSRRVLLMFSASRSLNSNNKNVTATAVSVDAREGRTADANWNFVPVDCNVLTTPSLALWSQDERSHNWYV